MSGTLAHICRHPIKSVGWEPLSSVDLVAGSTLPGDRRWAIAHEAAAFDGHPQGWQSKRNFVRGVASAPLMAVRSELSDDGQSVSLYAPGKDVLTIAPDTPSGSDALVDWIKPMWPDSRPPAARVVRADQQALTDVPDPVVSLLSVASNHDLGDRMGIDLSIHRWRGNLWIDGFAPFAEFDWIGRTVRIGEAVLVIDRRITRCQATTGNPETGLADADTLGALQSAFGHQDFGVYAKIVNGGPIHLSDKVELI